jgi:hypothetical protein
MRDIEWTVRREVVLLVDRAVVPAPTATVASGIECHAPRLVARDAQDAGRDEWVADVRRRVRDGVYDTRVVIEQVARRIIESGDL